MPHDPKLRQAVGRAIRDASTLCGWDEAATAALDAIEAAGWAVMAPKHVAQIDEMQSIMNEIKAAGWVLVPPEPTLAMTFAGQEALIPNHPAMPGPATAQVTTGSFDKIYRAMVAARPGAQP